MTPLELKTFVSRLRLLSTSFTTSYGERKHHFLLTTTPSDVSVPDEADQLSLAAYEDFLRSVTACCDAALAGVVGPLPNGDGRPDGCYITEDVPYDVRCYAIPLLCHLRQHVVSDNGCTLGLEADTSSTVDDNHLYRIKVFHVEDADVAEIVLRAVRTWLRTHPIDDDFDLVPEVFTDPIL